MQRLLPWHMINWNGKETYFFAPDEHKKKNSKKKSIWIWSEISSHVVYVIQLC
jgi:hypothetical protein